MVAGELQRGLQKEKAVSYWLYNMLAQPLSSDQLLIRGTLPTQLSAVVNSSHYDLRFATPAGLRSSEVHAWACPFAVCQHAIPHTTDWSCLAHWRKMRSRLASMRTFLSTRLVRIDAGRLLLSDILHALNCCLMVVCDLLQVVVTGLLDNPARIVGSFQVCSTWVHVVDAVLWPSASTDPAGIPDPAAGGSFPADQPQNLPTAQSLW